MIATIDDFKAQFVRDFPYLPVWDNTATYNAGEVVYYDVNRLFYEALNNGVSSVPTDTNDWKLVSDSIDNYVQDADITRAFGEADLTYNTALFSSTDILPYLYLTAHYLVLDIQAAQAGISSQGAFNIASKSVGSVSVSYSIPAIFQNNPMAEYLSKTPYGQKYMSFALPRIVGNVQSVEGATQP